MGKRGVLYQVLDLIPEILFALLERLSEHVLVLVNLFVMEHFLVFISYNFADLKLVGV